MKLTIEKTAPHLSETWFQAVLIVGDMKTPIGYSQPEHQDVIAFCEKLVKEFAKNKINIEHKEIYS